MKVIEEPTRRIVCEQCGDRYRAAFYETPVETVAGWAKREGWDEVDGEFICPYCIENRRSGNAEEEKEQQGGADEGDAAEA